MANNGLSGAEKDAIEQFAAKLSDPGIAYMEAICKQYWSNTPVYEKYKQSEKSPVSELFEFTQKNHMAGPKFYERVESGGYRVTVGLVFNDGDGQEVIIGDALPPRSKKKDSRADAARYTMHQLRAFGFLTPMHQGQEAFEGGVVLANDQHILGARTVSSGSTYESSDDSV